MRSIRRAGQCGGIWWDERDYGAFRGKWRDSPVVLCRRAQGVARDFGETIEPGLPGGLGSRVLVDGWELGKVGLAGRVGARASRRDYPEPWNILLPGSGSGVSETSMPAIAWRSWSIS